MSVDHEVRIPPPRAHLAGTLALLERFEALAGGNPHAAALRRFLDRPEALPEAVPKQDNTLKYDAYIARGPAQLAWGVAVGDRYEGAAMRAPLAALLAALPGDYRMDAALALGADLDGAAPSLTVAAGFDHPQRPPRMKLYFQEDRWGAGVASAGALREALAVHAPGCALPDWVPAERPVGVLTPELLPDGALGVKAYLGGASPQEAAEGAPPEAQALAAAMAARCPLTPGYYYLTLRMRPGTPHRYAINKIYDHVRLGFTRDAAELPAAWAELAELFAFAGRAAHLAALQGLLGQLQGVRVVPTASALEDGGQSADLYCAAWAMPPRAG
ncbi:MAG: hypothetical protein H6739_16485 [Alphaproteobacteria bacterium]|nr:hypothetical protein [Alphaproteobacteria bacterium]